MRAINLSVSLQPLATRAADCARWQLRAQVLNIAACFCGPGRAQGLKLVMALRIPVVVSLTLLALGASLAVQAQTPTVAGDKKRGQDLAYTCQGCHSIPNYKNVYPTYSVPKLNGQRPEYLVASLKAYKSGERSHGTMHSQASSMSEQDMADIAVFLAGDNVLTKSVSDVPATARPK